MIPYFLFGFIAAYLMMAAMVFVLQSRLIYPVPATQTGVPPGFERVTYRASDGFELEAGFAPPHEGRQTIVFFHGNGADWKTSANVTNRIRKQGFGVLAAEYRGYGGNPGSPSEQGLYADGRGALQFLADRGIADKDIVLVGNSIGSGVAVQMATEHDVRSVVLVSPFASLAETAARKMPWLPVRTLLRERYDNLSKIGRLEMPVLILHGEDDRLIKPDQAQALAAAQPRARLVMYEEWGHGLVVAQDVQQRIMIFVDDFS